MSSSFVLPVIAAAVAGAADSHAGTVSRLPSIPDAHGFAGAFAGVWKNRLLAAGGANFPDGVMPWDGGRKVWHDRLFALDLTAKDARWEEIGRLPEPNGYGVSLTLPEGVLLVGGGDAGRNFREVRLLSLDASGKPVFRSLPDLPEPLAQLCGAVVGRSVHVYGGITRPDATEASRFHFALDLDSPDPGWKRLPELPAAGRILATAAEVGGAFLVTGGCALAPDAAGKPARTYLKETWSYKDGKWTRLADLPRAAVAAASPAPVANGCLFVISGDDGMQAGLASPIEHKGFSRTILRFDPAADRWTTDGELSVPAPVTLPSVPWKDGFILFNGEVRPGVRTPQVLLYHPAPVNSDGR